MIDVIDEGTRTSTSPSFARFEKELARQRPAWLHRAAPGGHRPLRRAGLSHAARRGLALHQRRPLRAGAVSSSADRRAHAAAAERSGSASLGRRRGTAGVRQRPVRAGPCRSTAHCRPASSSAAWPTALRAAPELVEPHLAPLRRLRGPRLHRPQHRLPARRRLRLRPRGQRSSSSRSTCVFVVDGAGEADCRRTRAP